VIKMSYEKVKSIKIDTKQNKVFITCASNNVRPLTYDKSEFGSLSKLLKEEGKQAVELRILKLYEEGSFQQGQNKYTDALKVLRYVLADEHKHFDWRQHNAKYGTKEYKEEALRRESPEFEQLLIKALNYKMPKKRFVIAKKNFNDDVYGKASASRIRWLYDTDKATKYRFKEEAESFLNCFSGLEDASVVDMEAM